MKGMRCAYRRATEPSTPNVDATALQPPSMASFTMFSGSKYSGLGANEAPAECSMPWSTGRIDRYTVSAGLLGKLLVRQDGDAIRWGRLVEVEAYCGPDDRAAHSWRGRTPRTQVMFGPPGRAYVYLIYGMHHCLNFVTRPEGCPQAVLVRALAPGPGIGRTSGPGLICRALHIDRLLNGVPLVPPALYVADDGYRPAEVFTSPRV